MYTLQGVDLFFKQLLSPLGIFTKYATFSKC
jgi:hypothetical protein